MQFSAMKASGRCCEDDRTAGENPISLEQVTKLMADTQWCGCGAKPGHGLAPLPVQTRTSTRPMVLPGYGVGPHGLEMGVTGDMPNMGADYPLAYQLPDSSFILDPLDAHIWQPPTSRFGGRTDPWAPWGYAPGPKV